MGKLNAKAVKDAGPGRYFDGEGLWLIVSPKGARRWQYKFMLDGKERTMGLAVDSLAEARNARDDARRLAKRGVNPIEARNAATVPTFGAVAEEVLSERVEGFKNAAHRRQWRQTLEDYAKPLWAKPVDKIGTADILATLKPIWTGKPDTASRLRGRIEKVLDAARAKGLIEQDKANPARWRGHLDALLSKPKKLARGHHRAMPYADVPAFMDALRERDAVSALALEFLILTASRSEETRGARWSEIDLTAKVWTIPAARMKMDRDHRVPLSTRAAEIIETMAKARTFDHVFPGSGQKTLSETAFAALLKRMGAHAATTPHGFRSAFRDWCGDATHFPRELAEAALSHRVGDATEQAYRRSDALEKRRALMEAWATYCAATPGSNIVMFRGA